MDELAHRDSIKLCFVAECGTWVCPWSAGSLAEVVNAVGLVADSYGITPAWSCRDEALFASRQAHG